MSTHSYRFRHSATTTTKVFSMKLLIDAKAQRVLFAEAGKDVVDFLFSLLALPLSTAVKLVGKDCSIGSLYASVEELDDTYFLQRKARAALLRPTAASPAHRSSSSLLRLPEPSSEPPQRFYRCIGTYGDGYYCRSYVTDVYGTACPFCKQSMASSAQYVSGKTAESAVKGFVKDIVTYTVLDNLTVAPMSSGISSIALLNTLAVTDIGALQEKTVQLGYNEGLAILKAFLKSKTVLTDVFLGNNVVDLDNVDQGAC